MYLRFLFLSVVHWLVSFFAVALVLAFILPEGSSGWILNVPAWVLAFIFSALCASWAFSPYLPGRSEILTLMAMWLIVLTTGYMAYGLLFLSGPSIILGWEFLVQLLVQLFAVWLAAIRLRRRKLKQVLGEGMVM